MSCGAICKELIFWHLVEKFVSSKVSHMNTSLLEVGVDEKLRMQLLAEEQKLRSKQPEAWTKTKFRKYANFGRNRKKTAEEILGLAPAAKTEKVNARK